MQTQVGARIIPVDRWGQSGHLWPADQHELRYLLRKRHENGLDECVFKVGRRLLIDEAKFIAWVASHREAQAGR